MIDLIYLYGYIPTQPAPLTLFRPVLFCYNTPTPGIFDLVHIQRENARIDLTMTMHEDWHIWVSCRRRTFLCGHAPNPSRSRKPAGGIECSVTDCTLLGLKSSNNTKPLCRSEKERSSNH
ncbi:hypothetical protein CLAIMM_07394 [Cladophialophora immunda]|nr:hypothetical protein CLAIMM_07394 [Cladophialophora immunda]